MPDDRPKKMLVLHIAIADFNADDLDEAAGYMSEPDPPTDEDRLYVVTEEWMRADVGVVLVSIPGDKCQNDEFHVFARDGRIVGAHLVDRIVR